jgi:hypothetical protein
VRVEGSYAQAHIYPEPLPRYYVPLGVLAYDALNAESGGHFYHHNPPDVRANDGSYIPCVWVGWDTLRRGVVLSTAFDREHYRAAGVGGERTLQYGVLHVGEGISSCVELLCYLYATGACAAVDSNLGES